jgi:alcohol dehydrogenase class IV
VSLRFVHEFAPQRVCFGSGEAAATLAREVAALGGTRVLPRVIVYDAGLTVSLPVAMSVASGLNALAHCVDSMWAPASDPVDRAIAAEGIAALAAGLPAVAADPAALPGREQAPAVRAALDAPRALWDYGFGEADIPAAAGAILPAVPPGNPRPVSAGDLRRLLRAAWAGADPAALAGPDGGDDDDASDEESS